MLQMSHARLRGDVPIDREAGSLCVLPGAAAAHRWGLLLCCCSTAASSGRAGGALGRVRLRAARPAPVSLPCHFSTHLPARLPARRRQAAGHGGRHEPRQPPAARRRGARGGGAEHGDDAVGAAHHGAHTRHHALAHGWVWRALCSVWLLEACTRRWDACLRAARPQRGTAHNAARAGTVVGRTKVLVFGGIKGEMAASDITIFNTDTMKWLVPQVGCGQGRRAGGSWHACGWGAPRAVCSCVGAPRPHPVALTAVALKGGGGGVCGCR